MLSQSLCAIYAKDAPPRRLCVQRHQQMVTMEM